MGCSSLSLLSLHTHIYTYMYTYMKYIFIIRNSNPLLVIKLSSVFLSLITNLFPVLIHKNFLKSPCRFSLKKHVSKCHFHVTEYLTFTPSPPKAHLLITGIHSTCNMEALDVRRSHLTQATIQTKIERERMAERRGHSCRDMSEFGKRNRRNGEKVERKQI